MALTNAERQKKYRERHLKKSSDTADKKFMRLTLDIQTRNKLTRVAAHRCVSIIALITKWVDDAEQRILDKMTPKDEKKYFAATDLKEI
jgi:hypothetical protein